MAICRSSSSLGASWPWIAPPMQRIAAAAMMPSGVPPIPASMSVLVLGRHAEIAPATSPSVINRQRAPAARTSAISCLCRGRSRMHTVKSDTDTFLALATQADVLADRRADVDDVDALGTHDDLVHVEDRGRVEHRAALGHGDHRDRVGALAASATCRRSGRRRSRSSGPSPLPTSSPL